ncbi:GMC oxidoreductase [Frigidibacter sp. SD6-1]|uniref:GMC oxidoreductase n=1 Tax=Frigidibacter sp. SD6-1 TaxID=3032581 RepID=UPI0024DF750B|nr:GMC oxidoreductase [Frigidibacter sp. SD6-1]
MVDLVIGSGPAGVAAATALLARGRQVLMLDGGRELEPKRAAARDRMAARDPRLWAAEERADWQAPQFRAAGGQIRRYGSDFAMEPAQETYAGGSDRFRLRGSHAVGGLSNLWGAAVLPYAAADMAGWPITEADLAPHYRAVADFVPISGRADDLASVFPALDLAGSTPLTPSPQAERLLTMVAGARGRLARAGITIGQARQAVAPGCRQCGQCLHGCPWQLIWSARQYLPTLQADPNFSYRPGVRVVAFEEEADEISLRLESGETVRGERAFLGAGVLESARILLASMPGLGQLTLRDSAHGFLPMLHLWRAPRRPDRGPFHTLPQAFAELRAPEVSGHLIHAQIYSWNEFFEADLLSRYGRLPGTGPALRALARRLLVAQIFLHSDLSARVSLTLARDGRLAAETEERAETGRAFDAAARRFAGAFRALGLAPLSAARRLNPPGSSFHAGATLPMAATPAAGQSDRLGRPCGLSRLHLIDASCLPAIPATTITLPVMANAHRIGSAAPL